ncbi:type VII secretion protein EccE [Mycobacterium tilburgii]|uniref:type VII secretion protein EccE n=1 Tax=Mycobacterium tilburgii TaxID=44467 RepID=UPI001184208D|nr:type VII secretion protein EccE [Mycobacterium tilburgii]
MKAQRRFGLSLSWARVTTVFLIVVAILLIANHCPESWQGQYRIARWVGVGISAIVVLLSLVTHHGLTVTSGLAGWLWDWSADPGTTLTAGCTPALDHQRRFGLDKVGVREYDGRLVTVIALDGDKDAATRHRPRNPAPASVLVRSVAAGLRQFDVLLDGIDIVSVQMCRGGNAAELSKLDKLGPEEWGLVSKQPASYLRRTWLVLRMNPQANVAAVAARDSLASTLAAATERLVHDIDAPGCVARPLTADEIAEVDSAVLADLEPTWRRPGWRYLKHFNGFATSFWLTPSDITSETLEELWLPDAEVTVVTLQLTADDGQFQVAGLVRYHSDSRLPRGVPSGLNRLTGSQLAAVRASLPAPTTRPLLVVPNRELREDDDLVLQVCQVQEGAERPLASPLANQ